MLFSAIGLFEIVYYYLLYLYTDLEYSIARDKMSNIVRSHHVVDHVTHSQEMVIYVINEQLSLYKTD